MSATEQVDPSAAARANTFPWPPVLLAAGLVLPWIAGRLVPVPWPGLDDLPARIIGISFGVLGMALIVWAVVTLKRAKTTFMPHGTSEHLVTTGPFTRFRNPIYLGDTMLMLCIAELTKNIYYVGAAALFVVLVTKLQIIPEERHLLARFGDAYEAYRARSRRWI